METRTPAVEGRFYPGTNTESFALIKQIEKSERYPIPDPSLYGEIIGAILPHAGHVYSGYQTIPFFRLLQKSGVLPDTFIIVHPNHSGLGESLSLDEHDRWRNASGTLEVDCELRDLLPYPKDARAHMHEHSCEVILPYIQYYFGNKIKILPICMLGKSSLEAINLGQSVHKAIQDTGRNAMFLASSDFTHFHSRDEGFQLDQIVLDRIESKEIHSVGKVVRKHDISVCGAGPIMSLMAYANCVSSSYKMEILARGHSGEVHPSTEVVDYISMLFYL